MGPQGHGQWAWWKWLVVEIHDLRGLFQPRNDFDSVTYKLAHIAWALQQASFKWLFPYRCSEGHHRPDGSF